MFSDPSSEDRRLLWQCRRGMLELDLCLHAFFEQRFASLSQAAKAHFKELLDFPDVLLYAWFMGREDTYPKALTSLVAEIRTLRA